MSENRPLKIYTELDAKTNVAVSGNLNIHTTSSFNTVAITTSSQGMFDVAGALHELDQAIVDKGLEIKNSYEGARYRVVSFLDENGKAVINLTNDAPQGIQYFTTGNLEDVKVDVLIDTLDDGRFKNDLASVQLYVSGACLVAEVNAPGVPDAEFRLIAVNETVLALSGINNGPNGGMIYTLATTESNGLMSATDKALLETLSTTPVSYSLATTSADGLMSAADKTKLNAAITASATYSAATTSTDGLMSAADKTKVDYLNITSNNLTLTNLTASSGYVSGDFVVDGKITAQEYYTEYVSASVIYESGSTKFGNDSADTHQFSGSVSVSGSISASSYIGLPATHDAVTIGTANGLSLSGQQLTLGAADASNAGAVTTSAQTFAGNKTFSGAVYVNGNVGIGTSNPATKLTIEDGYMLQRASDANSLALRSYPSTGTGKNRIIDLYDTSDVSNSGYVMFGIAPTSGWVTNTAGAFLISGKNGAGTLQNLYLAATGDWPYPDLTKGITIQANTGYIGVGKTTPTDRLDINGNVLVTGSITATSINVTTYANLPTASATTNGIVTTGSQTMAGDKTFSGAVSVGGNAAVTGTLNTSARNTWNKPQVGAVTALTSSAGTLTVDLSATNNFSFSCAATTTAYTLGAPTNAAAGQSGIIVITQGGTSASTLAFNSFWKFPTGMDKTMSTTLNSVNAIAYYLPTAGYAICSFLKEVA